MYKRRRTKQEDLMPVKAVLEKVFKDLDLDKKIFDYEIMKSWTDYAQEFLKPIIAANTFAHRINKNRSLVIGVKSAVIANELHFIKPRLEEEFIQFIYERFDLASKPQSNQIKDIVFELRS